MTEEKPTKEQIGEIVEMRRVGINPPLFLFISNMGFIRH
jgi:hypothetical protein